jgi:23S rRNA (adenine2503-C2)-methyltransferase
MEVKKFQDESENVTKYVFTLDDACFEAALYRYPTYEERTVLCISTQCGCPVGCTFCGTGKRFVRNLDEMEIYDQVVNILSDIKMVNEGIEGMEQLFVPNRLQIMFMSMGEPFLNYDAVANVIAVLNQELPTAELLVSSIGPKREADFADFIQFSREVKNIGIQFSIHRAYDAQRDELIPFKKKMTLEEIRNYGVEWYAKTGRQVYLNYCIDGNENTRPADHKKLMLLFPPNAFAFTFSVVCSADETMKEAGYRDLDTIRAFEQYFIEAGYNTRIFDPAGQDSIGGGCGQLWYVQKWMKENG